MSMQDRIASGEFNNKMTRPEAPKEPTLGGRRLAQLSAKELTEVAEAVTEYQKARERYDADMKAYRRGGQRAMQAFREALMEEYGTTGNPKEPKLYELAEQYGHSAGFGEIAAHYGELADLIL